MCQRSWCWKLHQRNKFWSQNFWLRWLIIHGEGSWNLRIQGSNRIYSKFIKSQLDQNLNVNPVVSWQVARAENAGKSLSDFRVNTITTDKEGGMGIKISEHTDFSSIVGFRSRGSSGSGSGSSSNYGFGSSSSPPTLGNYGSSPCFRIFLIFHK